jgi:hypothetical protein
MMVQLRDIMAVKKNPDRTFRFSPISFDDYVALHVEATAMRMNAIFASG